MKYLFEPYAARRYRDDIQGIRAIGATLILIYHIWVHKVSGGVDVFFVVSGFLMTTLLLRHYVNEGSLRPFRFWGNIIKRIAPSAYVVLLATLVFGYFFLPPLFWRVSLNDLLFSAAHLQNFQLLRLSVDYLATDAHASPFQQFWALSMQVQFYLVLPFLLMMGLGLSQLLRSRLPLLLVIASALLLSLLYSFVITARDPEPSYFNTAARIWEFLAGALTALVIPYLRLNKRMALCLGLLGFGILLSTGLLVPRSVPFPGFIALVPVLGAVCLLVAGHRHEDMVVSKFLSNRYLVALGSMSFTVYLWHWPILVYAQHHHDTTQLSFIQGLGVIAAAVMLAYVTTALVETPFRRLPRATPWVSYLVGVLFFLPTVVPALSARQYAVQLHAYVEEAEPVADHEFFAGSTISLQDDATGVSLSQFASVNANKSNTIPHCLDGNVCESGDLLAERMVALVGGSHAAQWEPAFAKLGERYGFKVITLVQMSCALGYLEWMDENCRAFNENIVSRLAELKPDFVITNSTRLDRQNYSNFVEYVPKVYSAKWREITALGIPMVGIRDNPWFESNPSLCVWNNPEHATTCARPVEELYMPDNPATPVAAKIPLFHSVDLGNLYCADGFCPAVFEQRLMYFDDHHFTRTYVEFMTKAIYRELQTQTPEFAEWIHSGAPRLRAK